MAVETMTRDVEPALRLPAPRLSWGAIFGGAVAALGLWILLYALGVALGLSTINPENPASAQASGIFTGIWSAVAPLIALFVGGIVAGRGAGTGSRVDGATHGLVMWGLTTLVGAFIVASALAAVARGVVGVGKTAVELGGKAAAGAAQKVPQTFGLDANDALGPVNARLESEGKPPISADQLKAAVGDVVKQGVSSGQLSHEQLVTALSQNTQLSPPDAEEVASRIGAQADQAKEKLNAAAGQVQTKALEAADTTGKAFWGVFGALLLGLVSAVLGASLGVPRRQRLIAGPAPVRRQEEVYP